jgi:hypothetical protein
MLSQRQRSKSVEREVDFIIGRGPLRAVSQNVWNTGKNEYSQDSRYLNQESRPGPLKYEAAMCDLLLLIMN